MITLLRHKLAMLITPPRAPVMARNRARAAQARTLMVPTALRRPTVRTCRGCGCTDADCSGCIARTGTPCHWIAAERCSACPPVTA